MAASVNVEGLTYDALNVSEGPVKILSREEMSCFSEAVRELQVGKHLYFLCSCLHSRNIFSVGYLPMGGLTGVCCGAHTVCHSQTVKAMELIHLKGEPSSQSLIYCNS